MKAERQYIKDFHLLSSEEQLKLWEMNDSRPIFVINHYGEEDMWDYLFGRSF